MMDATTDSLRIKLSAHYSVRFPDDIFGVWHLACSLDPANPREAFTSLGVPFSLVGPFDVLAGAFDDTKAALPMVLHWRYSSDPAELFTVARGTMDNLHWGYWFDDGARAACVVSSVPVEGEAVPCGRKLVEALRAELEQVCAGGGVPSLAQLRSRVLELGTNERSEQGEAYLERYVEGDTPARQARRAEAIIPTSEGMGIAGTLASFEPLSVPDDGLQVAILSPQGRAKLIDEAGEAIRRGLPVKALKIAKEVWWRGVLEFPEIERAAYGLLTDAYEAMGRPLLADVVRAHSANRYLASVDLGCQQASAPFELTHVAAEGVDVLHFVGAFDGQGASVQKLQDAMVASNARLVVECARLERLEITGIRALMGMQNRARFMGGQVKLVGLRGQPLEILESTRLIACFDCCANIAQARSRFEA